jgi:hypothetical protein
MTARQIANIAFGFRGHGVIMMLQAFFDGSGKEDDHPVITVGGYLADDNACEEIESCWTDATEGKVFHLADFGGQYCKLGSGAWSENKRSTFLRKLCAIVTKPGVTIISASVDVSEYRSFRSSRYPKLFGPSYSMVAYLSLAITERILLKTNRFAEKLAYVFEKGEREHEIRQAIADYETRYPKNNSLRSLHILPKHTVLLQPCDLIAGGVQSALLAALSIHKSLDIGMDSTPVQHFQSCYSSNVVASNIIPPWSGTMQCLVATRSLLNGMDFMTERAVIRLPKIMSQRLKQYANQGKSRR